MEKLVHENAVIGQIKRGKREQVAVISLSSPLQQDLAHAREELVYTGRL